GIEVLRLTTQGGVNGSPEFGKRNRKRIGVDHRVESGGEIAVLLQRGHLLLHSLEQRNALRVFTPCEIAARQLEQLIDYARLARREAQQNVSSAVERATSQKGLAERSKESGVELAGKGLQELSRRRSVAAAHQRLCIEESRPALL